MYIKSILLKAWGTFTDHELQLSDRPGGLIVLHGDNGAGKTTTLEAVRGLLFGIPNNTKANHIHKRTDFRIAGTLVPLAGPELSIVRRKGTKNTLHDAAGQALGEDVLRPLLGGLDGDSYGVTFALDHHRLRAGGNRLASGDDTLAASLFGASLGAGVHEVYKDLISEAGDLFKTGASKPPLNAAIKTYKDKRKEQNELSVRTSDWIRAEDELKEAHNEVSELTNALGDIGAQIDDLKRLQKLDPIASELREAALQRDELGDVPLLDDEASKHRAGAEGTIREAARQDERLRGKVTKLDAKLGLLEVSNDLLKHSATITDLYLQVEVRNTDSAKRDELKAKQLRKQGEAEASLKQIGWTCTVEEAVAQRPDDSAITRVRSLAGQHQPLVVDRKAKQRALAEIEQQLIGNAARAAGLGAQADLTALETLLAEDREQGNLVKQRSDIEDGLTALQDEVATELASHRPFQGDRAELLALTVPPSDLIDDYTQRFARIARQRDELTRQLAEHRDQATARDQERVILTSQGDVATKAQLDEARIRRQDGWTLVKGALVGQQQSSEEALYDPERPLTAAFEHAVAEADGVSDTLRREASLCARFVQLGNDHTFAEDRLAELTAAVVSLAANEATQSEAWQAEWSEAGLEPQPPSLMATWRLRHTALTLRVRTLHGLERRRASLLQQESTLTERLTAALGAACAVREGAAGATTGASTPSAATHRPDAESPSLATLLSQAQGLVKANQQREGERTQLADNSVGLETKKATAARDLAGAEEDIAAWAEAWTSSLAEAHLRPQTEPPEANALLDAVASFRTAANEAAHYGNRIAQIETADGAFSEAVRALVSSLAPESKELDARTAARAMNEQLAIAHSNQKEAHTLAERRAELQEDLEQGRRDHEKAAALLADLTAAAGCTEAAELPAAEARAKTARELNGAISSLRKQIAREASSRPVEEVLNELAAVELAEVNTRLTTLKTQQTLIEGRASAALKQVGTLEQVLRSFDTSGRAANAAEEAEAARAKALDLRDEYIRRHLAAALLKAAIDRFREDHQGPLMNRGSAIFATLSLGNFSGLTAGYSDKDEPILHCVHQDGHKVTPDQLSDGERDQLYLALRVASLEHFLNKSDPIPLVVDDVLVNFDDKRSRAALQVLAKLAESTQVLLFTHHATIRNLAIDTVPAEGLRVVEL